MYNNRLSRLNKDLEKLRPQTIHWRRYLHTYPELSYHEFKTTDYIINKLKRWKLDIYRPLETGCIAILDTKKTGPTIALRADIDALPIIEEGESKKFFFSKNNGIAHCCGHDAHTANLLGAAYILSIHKESICGKVLFIFQPGEEKLPGGAKLLIETGFFNNFPPKAIFGLHTAPFLRPGIFGLKKGPIMARADEWDLSLQGKGGHAAMPNQCDDLPTIVSQFILDIHTYIPRSIPADQPTVISVGSVQTGHTHNILPNIAHIKGTVRSLNDSLSKEIEKKMNQILQALRLKNPSLCFQLNYHYGYPSVSNSSSLDNRVNQIILSIWGKEAIYDIKTPLMVAEDFSYYHSVAPSYFLFLGSGSPETDSTYTWHHPEYNVDERCLNYGITLFTHIVFSYCQKK